MRRYTLDAYSEAGIKQFTRLVSTLEILYNNFLYDYDHSLSLNDFHKFAEDYTLFELGSFDDSNAVFACHMTPIPVGKASEFLAASAA